MPSTFELYLRVLAAGVTTIEPSWWNYRGLREGFWRLYWHEGDGAAVECGGDFFAMSARRLYLIPPCLSLTMDCRAPTRQLWIHFEVAGVTSRAMATFFNQPKEVPRGTGDDALVQAMVELLSARRARDLVVQSHALALATCALASYSRAVEASGPTLTPWAETSREDLLPALLSVDEHMSTPLRVSQLAALCGLSREHFERRFRREMGCTPVEYIRERRMQVAVHRLCHTRRSVEQIALETGFGSRAYFTRMFTREKGQPPGRFRAEHGSIDPA